MPYCHRQSFGAAPPSLLETSADFCWLRAAVSAHPASLQTSSDSLRERRAVAKPRQVIVLPLRGSLPPLRQGPQAQRVQLDEAGGVLVVVGDGALLEGDEVLVVQRVRTVAADHMNAALVELEPHPARDHLLALVDENLQHLALGREPEAIVDELGVFGHQLVFEMSGAAVGGDR